MLLANTFKAYFPFRKRKMTYHHIRKLVSKKSPDDVCIKEVMFIKIWLLLNTTIIGNNIMSKMYRSADYVNILTETNYYFKYTFLS